MRWSQESQVSPRLSSLPSSDPLPSVPLPSLIAGRDQDMFINDHEVDGSSREEGEGEERRGVIASVMEYLKCRLPSGFRDRASAREESWILYLGFR